MTHCGGTNPTPQPLHADLGNANLALVSALAGASIGEVAASTVRLVERSLGQTVTAFSIGARGDVVCNLRRDWSFLKITHDGDGATWSVQQ